MSDRIIGVAVLNWRHGDPFGFLHFVGEKSNGERFIHFIPVVPEGLPDPGNGGAWWRFKGDATDVLKCYPSVAISGYVAEYGEINFHNTRDWSVRHVLFHDVKTAWVDDWPPSLLKKINAHLLNGHRIGNY